MCGPRSGERERLAVIEMVDYGAGDTDPLNGRELQGEIRRISCLAFYIGVITDWPWEVAAYISGCAYNQQSQRAEVDRIEPRCCSKCCRFSCTRYLYIWIRFAVIVIIGLPARTIVCFGRDRLDNIFLPIEERNGTERYVECHKPSQLLSNIIVPAIVVVLLTLWVSWKTAFCSKQKLICDLVNLVDEENLKNLVNEIKPKYPDKYTRWIFPIIPFTYVCDNFTIN